jgi:hypothetical protein
MAAEPLTLEHAELSPTPSVTRRFLINPSPETLWNELRIWPLCVLRDSDPADRDTDGGSPLLSALARIAHYPDAHTPSKIRLSHGMREQTVESVLGDALGVRVVPVPDSLDAFARLLDEQTAHLNLAFVDVDRLTAQIDTWTKTADFGALQTYFGAHASVEPGVPEATPGRPAKRRRALQLAPAATNSSPAFPADAAELARKRRDELLASERWFTSTEVVTHARGAAAADRGNPYEYSRRLRKAKRLFGVLQGGHYLHPAFQFDIDGHPLPRLSDLLAALPASKTNWSAALWLFQPTGRLGDARPADVFAKEPGRVIEAAEKDFRGDDALW